MNIEIRDAALEARIQKQIQATGSASVEEVLLRLLETQEEQDRWLLENRDAINTKIRRSIDQLDRGEGIPEDQLDAYLAKLKAHLNDPALRPRASSRPRSCPDLALHQKARQPRNREPRRIGRQE
jgi:DNA-directed RNA polymerase specialized sigma54-like protein